MGTELTQFSAEADDLHINGAVGHRVILSVDFIDNLRPGKDPSRPPHQEMQEAKLGHCEWDGLSFQQHLMTAGVNDHLIGL